MFFASDNSGPVHPQIMAALGDANSGFQMAYGADTLMGEVRQSLRDLFEAPGAAVYLVATGTAANALALATLANPWETVFCSPVAHIHEDECNAPEFYTGGAKLTLVGQADRMTPDALQAAIAAEETRGVHGPQRGPVSITQVTERGTVHSLDELRALTAVAREFSLPVHMDGARFANAVAARGCSPAELSWRAGVDVLCLGGTKMGLPLGEAVVFFDRELSAEFAWRCKQAGQLASKMRYLAAPWLGVLEHDAWLRRAAHANRMARRLADGLTRLPGVALHAPCEANGVFVNLPAVAANHLRAAGVHFYTFIGGAARFMCSWATSEEAVDRLLSLAAAAFETRRKEQ